MKKKGTAQIISLFIAFFVSTFMFSGCGNNVSSHIGDIGEIETENSITEEVDVNFEETKKTEETKENEEVAREAEKRGNAEEERLKAEAEAKKAEEERKKAEAEAKKSEAEAKKAEEERLKAEAEAKRVEEERLIADVEEEDELTPTQQTSINMLNYMTVLTQEINTSKGNQLFLEAARTSLYNDTNLEAVDTKTQAQIKQLVGTIDEYCMVDVKRERLEFIYEQNRAQALRQAIPDPMGLLSTVQSGNILKAVASVVYMKVDSTASYQLASNQVELQFIKEGWELDDSETKILQNSTTAQFDYMCNMVRDYDLPDEYVVRDTDVKAFVEYSNKTNLIQKIDWLVANEKTYQKFGPYWLELVKDYYESQEWGKCIDAIKQYEVISSKINRKDDGYANALPMVIIAAKEKFSKKEYVEIARKYCEAIIDNTKDEDWVIRYFVAQTYLDIYSQTKDDIDLKSAYDVVYYNVTTLIDEQRALNSAYLSPIKEAATEKGATKREKKEVKQYNRLLKEERKVAVPPVSEALYLNCDLMFAIADERNISKTERSRIEKLLHENGEALFLTKALDNKFREKPESINSSDIEIKFDGESIVIPAVCISDRSQILVSISGSNSEKLDDWVISEVKRPKNSSTCESYTVELVSKKGKDHKYQAGDKITISVTPVIDSPDETMEFTYNAVAVKKAFVFNGISFERK